MNKNTGLAIGAVTAIVIFGAFLLVNADDDSQLNDNSSQTSEQTEQTQQPEQTKQQDAQQTKSDQTLELSMENFEFSQEDLNVNAGETVTVNLTNNGGTHDFVIDELDVQSEVISTGQTTSVTFTVPDDAAGKTFAFYCSIANHRTLGMEGQLVVN